MKRSNILSLSFLVTVSIFLSGCYTQFSTIDRYSSEPNNRNSQYYSWSDTELAEAGFYWDDNVQTAKPYTYVSENYQEDEVLAEDAGLYFKDYETEEWYRENNFDGVYQQGYNDGFDDGYIEGSQDRFIGRRLHFSNIGFGYNWIGARRNLGIGWGGYGFYPINNSAFYFGFGDWDLYSFNYGFGPMYGPFGWSHFNNPWLWGNHNAFGYTNNNFYNNNRRNNSNYSYGARSNGLTQKYQNRSNRNRTNVSRSTLSSSVSKRNSSSVSRVRSSSTRLRSTRSTNALNRNTSRSTLSNRIRSNTSRKSSSGSVSRRSSSSRKRSSGVNRSRSSRSRSGSVKRSSSSAKRSSGSVKRSSSPVKRSSGSVSRSSSSTRSGVSRSKSSSSSSKRSRSNSSKRKDS